MILMIGDGMGTSHVTAARICASGLNMERLPVGGLQMTFSSDTIVTDSAASATAMATGFKTYNGAISVDPDGQSLKTVLEYAEETGMSTGLVVTCSITHATPAAFVSHIDDRGKYDEIAMQIAGGGVDVLFGGGIGYFLPGDMEEGLREDNMDLIAQLDQRMTIARSPGDFRKLAGNTPAAFFLSKGHPGDVGERGVSLAEMTQKAIEILSENGKGFFLMIEGSQIDWAAHDNDAEGIISEMLDFDIAVGAALDFAEIDGETLVIVTADHETGGFAVHQGSLEERTVTGAEFTTDSHTASMVPLLAFGPGSESFGGIHDNTFIGRSLIEYISGRR